MTSVNLINNQQNGILNFLQMAVQWHLLILHYWIEYCHHYFHVACSGRNWIMLYHTKFALSLGNMCMNCLKCYKISYRYSKDLSPYIVYNIACVRIPNISLTQCLAIKFFIHSAFTDHLLLSTPQSIIDIRCMLWRTWKGPRGVTVSAVLNMLKRRDVVSLRNRKFWHLHMVTEFLGIFLFLSFPHMPQP